MKKVNIYLMSDIKTVRRKSGRVLYVMEYGKTTLTQFEEITSASAGGAELMAAVLALRRLTEPCRLTIWLEQPYVPNNMIRNIWQWRARDWKTKQGRPVAYSDFWKDFTELILKHEHEVYKGLSHPYRNWMKSELEKPAKASVLHIGAPFEQQII